MVGVEENDSTKERGSKDLGNKGGHVRIACGQMLRRKRRREALLKSRKCRPD